MIEIRANLEELDSNYGKHELEEACNKDDISNRLHRNDHTLNHVLQIQRKKPSSFHI